MLPLGGFVGGSAEDRSVNVSVEKTVNLYPERTSGSAAAEWVLRKWPGYVFRGGLANGPVRGLINVLGRCLGISGTQVFEVHQPVGDSFTLTSTAVGAIESDGTRVDLLTNGEAGGQLFIRSGTNGYVLNLTDSVSLIAPVASFPPSRATVFIDGYGIALSSETSRVAISALEDFGTWDPLDVATRSTAADRLVTITAKDRDLWIWGELTAEPWFNNGDAAFPFVPRDGVFLNVGSAAAQSHASLADAQFWLGQSAFGGRVAYRMSGYSPQRISTHAQEQVWSSYPAVDDARGIAFLWQGHAFYVLTFPSANATWVFDDSTGLWHERLRWNVETGAYEAWPISTHVFVHDRHLLGSSVSGSIYEMSADFHYDDYFNPLRWLRRTPHVTKNRGYISYSAVQLECETGVGARIGQGDDPQVMLRWSADDGHTWSQEHWRSMGLRGEYRHRAIWRRLGRSRARSFEVVGSDPVPVTLLNLLVEVVA